jgi:hypothetical protein
LRLIADRGKQQVGFPLLAHPAALLGRLRSRHRQRCDHGRLVGARLEGKGCEQQAERHRARDLSHTAEPLRRQEVEHLVGRAPEEGCAAVPKPAWRHRRALVRLIFAVVLGLHGISAERH